LKKIRIPEKYKDSLEMRFNPDNFALDDGKFRNCKPCKLCYDFLFNKKNCDGCPCADTHGVFGCYKLLDSILNLEEITLGLGAISVRAAYFEEYKEKLEKLHNLVEFYQERKKICQKENANQAIYQE